MAATKLQSNPAPETLIMFVYPSIAADGIGRAIGRVLKTMPLPFVNHRSFVSSLIGLLLLPLTILVYTIGALGGLTGYFVLKLFGQRYLLTNRSLQIWSSIGQRLLKEVPLGQIAEISVDQQAGQEFYHAADLVIFDQGGNESLRLMGVPRADVFRQTILKARDAHTEVAKALQTISARAGR